MFMRRVTMIRSMTGFGRAETANEKRKLTVEMKAVNNRYLDFNIRMPKKFSFLESKIRTTLKEYMERGKVDVFITCEDYGDEAASLKYNRALAESYVSYYRQMAEEFGIKESLSVMDIARSPEVLTLGDADQNEDELWEELEAALRGAAQNFRDARELEGKRLRTDLIGKLDALDVLVDEVMQHEPEIMEAYRTKLQTTLTELLENRDIDESRIAAECVVYADKICTDEETVRLKSHIKTMKDTLMTDASIGRKLDFIAQEMNREANTTLSKAGDLITADIGIQMKTEIEKIREQIQNIE